MMLDMELSEEEERREGCWMVRQRRILGDGGTKKNVMFG